MRLAVTAGLLLSAAIASPAHSQAARDTFVAGSCGYTAISPLEILTAKHCITGEKELELHEFRHDWIILPRETSLPVSEIVALSYTELLKLGATLSFAGHSGCRVLPFPLGDGAFILDCHARPGDSGSGVFYNSQLVGVVSGFTTEGNAIVTSATEFERGN